MRSANHHLSLTIFRDEPMCSLYKQAYILAEPKPFADIAETEPLDKYIVIVEESATSKNGAEGICIREYANDGAELYGADLQLPITDGSACCTNQPI
jgi:hypothetical protein